VKREDRDREKERGRGGDMGEERGRKRERERERERENRNRRENTMVQKGDRGAELSIMTQHGYTQPPAYFKPLGRLDPQGECFVEAKGCVWKKGTDNQQVLWDSHKEMSLKAWRGLAEKERKPAKGMGHLQESCFLHLG
jgi:hypothetical protein